MDAEAKLNDLYREVILDHYRNPRCRKPISNPDIEELGVNPLCGDEIKVQLSLSGETSERISKIAVMGSGCSICMASGSILAKMVDGKTVNNASQLICMMKDVMHGKSHTPLSELGDVEALEGVKQFPVRIKCALLPWTTLEEALKPKVK